MSNTSVSPLHKEAQTDIVIAFSNYNVQSNTVSVIYNAEFLSCISKVAINEAGDVYIADTNNHRIVVVTSSGKFSTVAGIGESGYSGDDGKATEAKLSNPSGVMIDVSGDLYIADQSKEQEIIYRKVEKSSGIISTINFIESNAPANFIKTEKNIKNIQKGHRLQEKLLLLEKKRNVSKHLKKDLQEECYTLVENHFNKYLNGLNDDVENTKTPKERVWYAEKIGSGGFGSILKVTKRNPKNLNEIEYTNAVKVIPNSTMALSESISTTKLDHENVIKILDVRLIRNICCLFMDFLEHGSLQNLINKKKVVSHRAIFKMLHQCCQVLLLMKQKKIVHSDIKPDNILIKSIDLAHDDINIVFCDFGLALRDEALGEQHVGGTGEYFAPELKKDVKPTFHSDLYALGVTFSKLQSICKEECKMYIILRETVQKLKSSSQESEQCEMSLLLREKFKSSSQESEECEMLWFLLRDEVQKLQSSSPQKREECKISSLLRETVEKLAPISPEEIKECEMLWLLRNTVQKFKSSSPQEREEAFYCFIFNSFLWFKTESHLFNSDEKVQDICKLIPQYSNETTLPGYNEPFISVTRFLKYACTFLKNDKKLIRKLTTIDASVFQYADDSIRNDREFIFELVYENKSVLRFASDELRKDKLFMLKIVQRITSAFEYADKSLFSDKEFIIEAVAISGHAFAFADESLRKDRNFVQETISTNVAAFGFADDSLRTDNEFIFEIAKEDADILYYSDKSVRDDSDFMFELVKFNGNVLKYLDQSFDTTREEFLKEFVVQAVTQNSLAFRFADSRFGKIIMTIIQNDNLYQDENFVLYLMKRDGLELEYVSEELKENFSVVLEAVKQNGIAIKFAASSLRKNKEIVLTAIKENGLALKYIDTSLRNDEDIVLEAMQKNIFSLEHADNSLKKHPNFMIQAIKQNRLASEFIDPSLWNDKEFVNSLIQTELTFKKVELIQNTMEMAIQFTNESLLNEIVLETVKQTGKAIQFASNIFKDNEIIVLEAVKQNGESIQFASKRLQDNEIIVLEAVKQNGEALKYTSNRFKDNEIIVLEAVKQNGESIQFASYRLQDNETIVLEAVKQNGEALKYASDRFKDNEIIVLETVKQNGKAIQFASNIFKDNEIIVLEAVKQNGESIQFASYRLQDNETIVLEAVKQNGKAIQFASNIFKDNEIIVLEAVKQNGEALKYASDRFKDNEIIVLEAVKQNGKALEFASKRLQDNEIIVLEAVKQNGESIQFASKRLQDNEIIVLEAVKQNGKALHFASTPQFASNRLQDGIIVLEALQFASKRLQDNETIVLEAVKQNGEALKYTSNRLKGVILFADNSKEYALENIIANPEEFFLIESHLVEEPFGRHYNLPAELQSRDIFFECVKTNSKILQEFDFIPFYCFWQD